MASTSKTDSRFYVRQIQESSEKLRSATSPEETRQWAREIRTHADALTGAQNQKTALTVEAIVPDSDTLSDIAKEISDGSLPGVREVTYRRDSDGTNRLRITASQEALGSVSRVMTQMGQHFEDAYKPPKS